MFAVANSLCVALKLLSHECQTPALNITYSPNTDSRSITHNRFSIQGDILTQFLQRHKTNIINQQSK